MGQNIMQPLITTIIPTYKRPHMLKRAVYSVLKQNFQNFHVCVFDNASNDETEEIMQQVMKHDSRVKYHRHSQNIGMAANYEYALHQVKTPYFSLLSDDDVLLPSFYDIALKGFHGSQEIGFSAASSVIMDKEGKIHDVPLAYWSKEGYYGIPEGLLEMCGKFILPTTILFNREVLNAANPDWKNLMAWDSDFLLQIAAKYPIFISKEICGVFLFHSNSFSVSQSLGMSKEIETLDNWAKAYARIRNRLKENPSVRGQTLNMADKRISSYFRDVSVRYALNFMAQKKYEDARKALDIYHVFYEPDFQTNSLNKIVTICHYIPMMDLFLKGLKRIVLIVKRLFRKFKFRNHLQEKSKVSPEQLLKALNL